MRKPDTEDYILIGVGILLFLWMLWVLTACASKQASNIEILWHDGECMMLAKGLSMTEAQEIRKDWHFQECDIQIESDVDGGTPKLPGKKE